MGSCSTRQKGQFKIPILDQLNTYPNTRYQQNQKGQIKNIVQNIAPNQSFEKFQNLGAYIYKSKNKTFQDHTFMVDMSRYQWQYLQILRNQKGSQVYWKYQTKIDSIKQNQLQFSYLTSVFYQICDNQQLKHQIFITKKITKQKAFILRLFCNGQLTNVIVDEKVPVSSVDNLTYLDIQRGKQIWPYLLQKSWCKQIGSYKKALGLSPQDAFQQITGIPAYSYQIQFLDDQQIQNVIKRKQNWIVFTAKIRTSALIRTRQIFYLEKYENQKFYLRSPYFSYKYKRQQKGGNRIVMNLQKLREFFQYLTVGYVHYGYVTKSVQLISKKRQELFYQLQVSTQENVNIRFSQFYEEYFKDHQQKSGYDYSPIFMELYDQQYRLVNYCEGCPRTILGSRSSNLNQQIFVYLKSGKYYLRIEVDWVNEIALNRGNILIYSSEGNVNLRSNDLIILEATDRILKSKIMAQYFRQEQLINEPDNEIKLNILEKRYKYILQIINTTSRDVLCQVTMNGAENIRVRNKDMVNFKFKQKLNSKEISILQIIPQNPKQSFYLPSVSVHRL